MDESGSTVYNQNCKSSSMLEDTFGKTGATMVKWGVALLALNALWKASEIIKNVKVDITITK